MKKPFNESPTWWQAAIIVAIVLGIAVICSMLGCKTSAPRPKRIGDNPVADTNTPAPKANTKPGLRPVSPLPPVPPLPPLPNSFIPLVPSVRVPQPESVRGGIASIASVVGNVTSYDAACSNDFGICRVEFHPCVTNQFEIWPTTAEGVAVRRWYCGTNVIRWNAEAGVIYVPEYLDGTNWISDSYFSTNAPGVIEAAYLHYIDDGSPPHRIYRIRVEEP